MSVVIVIPARFASTRYPGKPLVALKGAGGVEKPLIQRSWEAACKVRGVDRVVVATDDDTIAASAIGFGADVVMTSADCANGTERCADALDQMGEAYDLIVNLQGDAPLTPPWFVEDLIAGMADHPTAQVATPVLRCDAETLNGFQEDRRNNRIGGTTAVFDAEMRALYFSKEVIPYTGRDLSNEPQCPVFHHVGVYAYRPGSLMQYRTWGEGPLERWEGLEQLRFMENGERVLCVEVDARNQVFWELNNPEDVPKIEAGLSAIGAE